jgi:hypothetical protein
VYAEINDNVKHPKPCNLHQPHASHLNTRRLTYSPNDRTIYSALQCTSNSEPVGILPTYIHSAEGVPFITGGPKD